LSVGSDTSHRSGARLYVDNDFGNSISVIDAASASVVGTTENIPAPTRVMVDTCGTDDSVSRLDLVARTLIGNTKEVGDVPLAPLVAGQDTLFAIGFDDTPAR